MSIDDIVTEVRLDTRKSQKSGKNYTVLVIKLSNGYEIENFVEKPVEFMINTLNEQDK